MAGGNKEAEGAAGKQQAQKPPVQRRRLFGSRSNGPKFGDKPKPKQEQKETAQAVEEEVKQVEEIHEFETQAKGEDHSMEYLLSVMQNSKTRSHSSLKGFLSGKNSKEYTAVMDGIRSVLTYTKIPFKDDSITNLDRVKNVSNAYFKLVEACNTYINKQGGTEGAGLARKNTVKCVLALAEKDITAVQQCYFDIYHRKISEADQAKLTWDEVIRRGREATIEVDDLHNDDVFKPLGANLKTGDKASRLMKGGVFTKEENLDISKSPRAGVAFHDTKNDPGDYGGKTTSVTNRNVATSRVADLLGLTGIVEESKTVNVKDKKSGKTYRGNMMSIAKGKEGDKEIAELKGKTISQKTLAERQATVLSSLAPTVQKELSSLQVLDYICGQNDRHTGNYFMERNKEGKIAHIHGIDNDQSFSTGVDFAKVMDNASYGMDKMRPVVGRDGELVIPYMDRQLADNILNLDPEVLEFALKDLLGPEYIKRAVERFKMVKTAIQKEPKDSPRFKKDNEWNDDTARDMLEQDYTTRRKKLMKEKGVGWSGTMFAGWDVNKNSTYFAQFVSQAMGFSEGIYEGME